MAKSGIFNNKGASTFFNFMDKNKFLDFFFPHDGSSADATILAISDNFLAFENYDIPLPLAVTI